MSKSGLSDPGHIKEVLARHGFHFSKALGQNFLINPGVCPAWPPSAAPKGAKALSRWGRALACSLGSSLKVAPKVCAVELDSRLFPRAGGDPGGPGQRENYPRRCDEAGFEPAHPAGVWGRAGVRVRQPALLHHLPGDPAPAGGRGLPLTSITVMVQKEAAQRLCAAPGSGSAGP